LTKDGYVTGQELGLYLQSEVLKHARQTPQYGKIKDYKLSRGDFVFIVGTKEAAKSKSVNNQQVQQAKQEQAEIARLNAQIAASQEALQSEQQAAVSAQEQAEIARKQAAEAAKRKAKLEELKRKQAEIARKAEAVRKARLKAEAEARKTKERAEKQRQEAIQQTQPRHGKVFQDRLKDGSLGPKMVWIKAGSFRMGDIQSRRGNYDEKPVHKVSVSRFAMGRYEITFSEYDKFAKATGKSKPNDEGWGRGNRPVINVSWNDAVAKWLSQQTGYIYRLPTEAEWEYAARAGTTTQYWWGNTASHEYMNYSGDSWWGGLAKGKDRWKRTAPVGSFAANQFGIYDTAGNVWEWCADIYSYYYYKSSPSRNPKGPSTGRHRVKRGGAWYDTAQDVRAANRDDYSPDRRSNRLGFRLLRQP